jgi:iron(III) transport system ATP-binding protein
MDKSFLVLFFQKKNCFLPLAFLLDAPPALPDTHRINIRGKRSVASVELRGIRKAYGKLTVADGIDLAIAHGELVCLLGPSGCGKTTTLRLIAGFMAPDAGEIRVGDKLLSSAGNALPPERRNMSMIFQSYALWPHMTVAENVAYGLTLRRMPRPEIEKRVATMLGVAKLQALASRYPGELSGGQQQRVALARALAVEPETLLLDEPLSNLDTNLREEMRFEIRRLHDEFRYTTVYVTHDQLEAMTTADRIVVMNAGSIEQIGAPEDVFQRPQTEFVARFLGGTNILRGPIDAGALRIGPTAIAWSDGTQAEGQEGLISIRPHEITLTAQPAEGPNTTIGTILRHTYIGAQRDYLVAIGDTQLRVIAPLAPHFHEGDTVGVHLPRQFCRALPK